MRMLKVFVFAVFVLVTAVLSSEAEAYTEDFQDMEDSPLVLPSVDCEAVDSAVDVFVDDSEIFAEKQEDSPLILPSVVSNSADYTFDCVRGESFTLVREDHPLLMFFVSPNNVIFARTVFMGVCIKKDQQDRSLLLEGILTNYATTRASDSRDSRATVGVVRLIWYSSDLGSLSDNASNLFVPVSVAPT